LRRDLAHATGSWLVQRDSTTSLIPPLRSGSRIANLLPPFGRETIRDASNRDLCCEASGCSSDGRIRRVISLQDFEETGALLSGHFRLSSGLHSDKYLQCARLLMWPKRAEAAGRELGGKRSEFDAAAIVSPALGGVVIGQETARALDVPAMFVERKDGAFALRRGFSLEPGQKVGVVEDVFTTGKSTREATAAVEAAGGRVVAVGSIVNRGLPPDAFSVPARSLLSLSVPSWPEAECPLCAKGVAIDSPGSRFVR